MIDTQVLGGIGSILVLCIRTAVAFSLGGISMGLATVWIDSESVCLYVFRGIGGKGLLTYIYYWR